MRQRHTRLFAVVVTVTLLAAACGGSKKSPVALGSATPQVTSEPATAAPSDTAAPASAAPTAKATKTSSAKVGGRVKGNPNTSVPVPTSGTAPGFTFTPANVYSGAANTTGITASNITICMHAAISLGAAFNETAADIAVFWNWLNDNGGILGRKVTFSIEDDAYTAQGAQQAESNCQAKNPFLMLGGIGFDQEPVVRDLAEQNHIPYIYTMADKGTGHYTYSFTGSPTIDQVGRWVAQAQLANHYPGPYGAVYVKDAHWVEGWNTYQQWMDGHGGSSVDANAYTMNAGGDASGFGAYIQQLKLAGVKTVFLWMNAVAFDAFVGQAANQGYYPAYVTPDGFNLVTQTVGSNIDDKSPAVKQALGVWITPAYDPTDTSTAWYPEEKRMLDVYAKYDSGHAPDDIDWMAWLAFRQVSDLLTTCGKTCTRNDLLGIFRSGWKVTTGPLCTVDFSANSSFGGQAANVFVAKRSGGNTVWSQTATCQKSF